MLLERRVRDVVGGMFGQRLCRRRVGRGRSLSLGFGRPVWHGRTDLPDDYYGEWELGTYDAAWRIVRGTTLLLGSADPVDAIGELDDALRDLVLGAVASIELPSPFDVRVTLTNETCIDFACASSADDEMFHIFGPLALAVDYSVTRGWSIGRSDVPLDA